MKILITGFMPFGGHDTNVTQLLLDSFQYNRPNVMVETIILPTIFHGMKDALNAALDIHQPDVLIHLGEHAKAKTIRLERVAINFDDARIPDNNGDQPIDVPIIKHGAPAYFSHLPLRKIEVALKVKDIPVSMSYSAGAYVCNHLFYLSENIQAQRKNRIASGFIHIPLVKEQDERAPFTLDQLKKALEIIIDTCASI